jgi:hypothetical protein
VQVRLNHCEPGITQREPDADDNLTEREPKSALIASRSADDCKPLQVAPGREAGEGLRDRPGASSRQHHYVFFKEVPNDQDG